MSGHRWTEREDDMLVSLTESGMSASEIGRVMCLGTSAVEHRRIAIGCASRQKRVRLTRLQMFAVAKARKAGMTWVEISKHAHMPPSTLSKAYKRQEAKG